MDSLPSGKTVRAGILGLPVDLVTAEEVLQLCRWTIEHPGLPPRRIITLNPEMAVRALKDPALSACFRGEVLVVPDGIGIVLALRRRGYRLHRLPGIELAERLAAVAARCGWPVFFFGGRPGIAAAAAENLVRRYPCLPVAGTSHGYLSSPEEAELIKAIAASGAKLLFVGLGTPKQEIWLAENLAATGARVGIGLGGSLDVWAGEVPRAPEAWRRLGLEWAYRLFREPRRRWRRILSLPLFFWQAVLLPPPDREKGKEG